MQPSHTGTLYRNEEEAAAERSAISITVSPIDTLRWQVVAAALNAE
jgi:hypothetical protein